MTEKRIKTSDVIGNSYYNYTLTSTNNTPSINSTISISCSVTDIYGQSISGKSITLYLNGVSQGARTTASSGSATWNNITMSTGGLQVFSVENSKIEIFVDNKSEVGHTHSQYLTEHQSLANYVTTTDSRLSDARTPTSHAHGNIDNNGRITSDAVSMAGNGQYIVFSDSTNGTIKRTSQMPAGYLIDARAYSYLETPANAGQDTINIAINSKLNNKLDKTHSSYKGKNVVTNSSTGEIEFEEKNNHTHSGYATTTQLGSVAQNVNNLGQIVSGLADVAATGDYDDLINAPTNISTFNNDVGYLTTHQDISHKEEKIYYIEDNTTSNFIYLPASINITTDTKILLKFNTACIYNASFGIDGYYDGSESVKYVKSGSDTIKRDIFPVNTVLFMQYNGTDWRILNSYNLATTSIDGLLSAEDKAKVDNIPTKISDLPNDSNYYQTPTAETRYITVTSPTSGSNYFSGGTREIIAVKWGQFVNVSVNFYGVNSKQESATTNTTIGTMPSGWRPITSQYIKATYNNKSSIDESTFMIGTDGAISLRTRTDTAVTGVTYRMSCTYIA